MSNLFLISLGVILLVLSRVVEFKRFKHFEKILEQWSKHIHDIDILKENLEGMIGDIKTLSELQASTNDYTHMLNDSIHDIGGHISAYENCISDLYRLDDLNDDRLLKLEGKHKLKKKK